MQVKVDKDNRAAIAAIAEQENLTPNAVVNRLIDRFLRPGLNPCHGVPTGFPLNPVGADETTTTATTDMDAWPNDF